MKGGEGRTVAGRDNARPRVYSPDMGFENGRVLRVALRAHLGSDQQVMTFHYDLDDGDLIDRDNRPQALADVFRDDVLPHWKARYSTGWTCDPVVVTEEKDPQNPLAPRGQWTSGVAGAGTATASSDLLPRAAAVLVQLKTDHIGRRFRGRNFLGGLVEEGVQNDGQWSAGKLASEVTWMGFIPREPDIALGSSGSSADWSVYSRTQRAADLDPYLSKITSVVVTPYVHWLRSRRQF